ncbi:MAG TPA: hypothetical protein VMZ71_10110 [Gemmataceae bacterium]|nr:hypothetical protein [Gemmataceae bacterium]
MTAPRPGYALIAVLVVVVVLSLTAYQFVEMMTSEYRAAARTGDTTQAKLSATSAVHYAMAMISDPAAYGNDLGGNPYDAQGVFSDIVVNAGEGRRESRFSVVSSQYVGGPLDNPGSFVTRNGVIDEMGKLNINTLIQLDPTGQVLYDALLKLPNMTEEIADAIVDWVDKDDDTRPAGAEASYYLSLSNAYRTKNGPLNSVDELLFVRGVTAELLHGTDKNRNGVADDGDSGTFTRGWADMITVYGRELNVDNSGALRLYLGESEDMPGLYSKLQSALGQEMADYVMAFKMFTSSTATNTTTTTGTMTMSGSGSVTITVSGASTQPQGTVTGGASELNAAVATAMQGIPVNKKRLKSVLDMYGTQVTLPKLPAEPGMPAPPTVVVPCPLNDPAKMAQYLPLLMDKTTATTNVELIPRLNVVTAPREVLLTVPGMTEEYADKLIEQRATLPSTDPATTSGAWVMTVGGIPPATFKTMEKYITGRTMVYRVQGIGYSGVAGGPVARVEAVFDVNQGAPRILYFRDLGDLDNPRGFQPPAK